LSISHITSILIVENEPLIAMDIEVMLIDAGVQAVHHVQSCQEALDWLSDNSPEVVILDLHLRDGPGTVVAEALHARAIPFIVYSGDTIMSAGLSGVTNGAPWLAKPCTPDELAAAIRVALGLPA
jgi:DNA-binding response OmpR family regulator